MAGRAALVGAVILGGAAGFVGGLLASPGADRAPAVGVAALEERVAALEAAPAPPPRDAAPPDAWEARLRAVESGGAPGTGPDPEAALAALLADPSPELDALVAAAVRRASAAGGAPGAGDAAEPKPVPDGTAEEWAAKVDNDIDVLGGKYGLTPGQVDLLRSAARRYIDAVLAAKAGGRPGGEFEALEVALQGEVRGVVGDGVYAGMQRDRLTREARGGVYKLATAVGALTEEQHRRIDRILEDDVERYLPDIVRVRSEPLTGADRAAVRERLDGSRAASWERIRDEVLTEEQRRRLPGK